MSKFTCPHWQVGQSCVPYFYVSIWWRVPAAFAGACIGLAAPSINFFNAYRTTAPGAALYPSVIGWGIALIVTGVLGMIVALHHEKDIWGCILAGVGTPSALLALAALPQIVR